MSGALLRIDKALESHLIYELLGRTEWDFIFWADSKSSVLAACCVEKSSQSRFRPPGRALWLTGDVCHECHTSMPGSYSPFSHPTSPRMLSLFPLSPSSQVAPPCQGEADATTALLKTLQGHPFSLRIKSNGHSSSNFPLIQWVPNALASLLFSKCSRDTPDAPSWKHFLPSETPSSPQDSQTHISSFLQVWHSLYLSSPPCCPSVK